MLKPLTKKISLAGLVFCTSLAQANPCGDPIEIPTNEWVVIGIPCQLNGQTIDQVFSDDLGTYGVNWVMYKQNGWDYQGNGGSANYTRLSELDTLVQGVGYWIFTDDVAVGGGSVSTKTWQVDSGLSPAPSPTPVSADPFSSARSSYISGVHSIDLKELLASKTTPTSDIQVMLSNPFPEPVDWGENVFERSSDYVFIGVSPGPTYFHNNQALAYVYDGSVSDYAPITTDTPGLSNRQIEPGQGYWVRLSETFQTEWATGTSTPFALMQAQPVAATSTSMMTTSNLFIAVTEAILRIFRWKNIA